jgi:AraC-like DNA-binding protein
MDVLGALLGGPRADGVQALRVSLRPPFAVRVEDEAPLAVVCLLQGSIWLLPDDAPPRLMAPGSTALVRGPDHYTVADHLTSATTAVIGPGNISRSPSGAELCQQLYLGPRAWGDDRDAEVVMMVGTYSGTPNISASLLSALPPAVVLDPDARNTRLTGLLTDAAERDEPGQDAVVHRVLDLVLVDAVRAWLVRPDSPTPDWYQGRTDPVVRTALQLMHEQPARAWTVAALAAECGSSRAGFARRFRRAVGRPPVEYLTEWRLSLAADLLQDPDTTLDAIARAVGYGSGFALSAAFKRVRGVTPRPRRGRGTR